MSPTSVIVETCPVCRVEFTASPKRPGNHGTPTKTCPNGHATPVDRLRASRGPQPEKVLPAVAVKPTNTAGDAVLLLAALLDCYDRLLATLPKQARALTEGIFGGYIELARKMVR